MLTEEIKSNHSYTYECLFLKEGRGKKKRKVKGKKKGRKEGRKKVRKEGKKVKEEEMKRKGIKERIIVKYSRYLSYYAIIHFF
jgi:hypothetical protein